MPIINPYKDLTIKTSWDAVSNSMQPDNLATLMQSSNVTHNVLSFIVSEDGQCKPAWGGYHDYSVENSWGKNRIAEFLKNGGTATISFGGANGTPLESVCSNVPTLVEAISKVSNTYGIKKLDFDIEGAHLSDANGINNLAMAVSQIQKNDSQVQISVTLPVLPSGLTQEGLNAVKIFKEHNVDFCVNIMAMDYGPYEAPDLNRMGDYAIAAIDATHQQLRNIYPNKSDEYIWRNMLALTPMIGVNDVWHYSENKPEYFKLDDARKISNYAAQKGFEIRYWSLDRDLPCDQQYASATCSGAVDGVKAQSNPFDYAKALKGGFLLSMLLANKVINMTTTLSNNSRSDEDSDALSSSIKTQLIVATGLFLAAMGGGALLAKKYGPQVAKSMQSAFGFWKNKNNQQEENYLFQEVENGYSTFQK